MRKLGFVVGYLKSECNAGEGSTVGCAASLSKKKRKRERESFEREAKWQIFKMKFGRLFIENQIFNKKKKKIEVARWGSVRVFSNFEMGN